MCRTQGEWSDFHSHLMQRRLLNACKTLTVSFRFSFTEDFLKAPIHQGWHWRSWDNYDPHVRQTTCTLSCSLLICKAGVIVATQSVWNGNPLQCSCLENPRDGRAWWAAVYVVTQSRTRLKRLSSSSSSSVWWRLNMTMRWGCLA